MPALLFSEPNLATLVWEFNRAAVGVKSEVIRLEVSIEVGAAVVKTPRKLD